jgi:fermentation-respiration switch protein FrsA (DUF1100 family)/alkylhydroperoxidase/carboxymuconolactone decarboxylase family protein YurZ
MISRIKKYMTVAVRKSFLGLFAILTSTGFTADDRHKTLPEKGLNCKEESIVSIAVYTAKGDQGYLKNALSKGLDAGLTINEITEVLVQLYAYTGFPRSLNALHSFIDVLKERKQKGIKDELGKTTTPLPANKTRLQLGTEIQTRLVGQPVKGAVYEFAPAIDQFLKEHLFADIFGRDNLDFKTREIATIAALAGLGGAENQLRSHFAVGMYNGLTEEQVNQIITLIRAYAGAKEGETASRVFQTVLTQKQSNSSEKTAVPDTRSATEVPKGDGVYVEKVFFPNRTVPKSDINISANLFLPPGFDKAKKYPAILIGHPAGGVKEQTAGLYARKLAEQGYITLAFDASYQGESGGEPRFLEDPSIRVEDFSTATDFLSLHASVDADRIGVLGICAGGGFAIKAAQTEHRLKAVATVSMVDLGQLRREGLGGVLKSRMQERLDEVGRQRTKEANGGPVKYVNYVFNSPADIPANATGMYREGYDYYRTPRGQHPNSQNKYVFTSLDKLMNFTALDHVEMISPRPLLMIVGSEADSRYFSDNTYAKAGKPSELFEVKGATHIDMYDKPQYVEPAVKKLVDFFGKNLK